MLTSDIIYVSRKKVDMNRFEVKQAIISEVIAGIPCDIEAMAIIDSSGQVLAASNYFTNDHTAIIQLVMPDGATIDVTFDKDVNDYIRSNIRNILQALFLAHYFQKDIPQIKTKNNQTLHNLQTLFQNSFAN